MHESIGVNLRVTGHSSQGGRKYMEDEFVVAYQRSADGKDLEYAYFGIFDGHGGREAAMFAKSHLMCAIVEQKNFWSKNDDDVLKAIKDGFIQTHHAMWKEVGKWPKTSSGLPSTAGTTASIAFIKKGKLYIGHVGDSAIVLGYKEPGSETFGAQRLTKDHKPDSPSEKQRIENLGGCVMSKSGVQRVVWNRPRVGHKGPVRRSTLIDQVPFLAVARSLGDLWSYSYEQEEFIVSPEPDVSVMTIDVKRDRCLILGSDGLWNMLTAEQAVQTIHETDTQNDRSLIDSLLSAPIDDLCNPTLKRSWTNPSKVLVDQGISRWLSLKMRADNTSVVTVILDPPGPPRTEVIRKQCLMKKLRPREEVDRNDNMTLVCNYVVSPRNRSLLSTDSSRTKNEFEKLSKTSNFNFGNNKTESDICPLNDETCDSTASNEHSKQKGTKRKIVEQSLQRLKFHKADQMESGARTCQSDLVPLTKPCTRSRIQCL